MIGHLLSGFYVLTAICSATATALLMAASMKAPLALRPWFAAAIPAAFGYFIVTGLRIFDFDDEHLTGVARGVTLYGLLVLYNALPYAAIRHASELGPVALDVFVAEVERQLVDTGEVPVTPEDDKRGDEV